MSKNVCSSLYMKSTGDRYSYKLVLMVAIEVACLITVDSDFFWYVHVWQKYMGHGLYNDTFGWRHINVM